MTKHFKSAMNQVKADTESLATIKEKAKNSETTQSKISNLWMKKYSKYAVAASIGLVVVGGAMTTYAYKSVPISYVSVDVNPSVELAVSRSGEVTDAYSYNEDGDVVLESAEVVGLEVADAVDAVVTSASDNGYIQEDGSSVVVITPETDDDSTATELSDAAKAGAEQAISETGETVDVYINEAVSLETRDEAIEAGVSPGKYDMIIELQSLDPTATVEEYADATMAEIIDEIEEIDPDYGLDIDGDSEEVDPDYDLDEGEASEEVDPDYDLDEGVDPGYDIDEEEGVDSDSDSTDDDRNNSVNNDNNNGNIGNGGDNGNDDNNGNDDSNNTEGNNGNGNGNNGNNGNGNGNGHTEDDNGIEEEDESEDSSEVEENSSGNNGNGKNK